MYGLYPATGIQLPLQNLDADSFVDLNEALSSSAVIHIYGLSLTGKTLVAQELARLLHAHCIDEMLIVRSVAYCLSLKPATQYALVYKVCFEQLSFGAVNNVYIPYLNKSPVRYNHLYTEKVERIVNKLLNDTVFLDMLAIYCRNAIEELQGSRIILVSSSANPRYMPQSDQSLGFLLEADLEEVERRWYEKQAAQDLTIHSAIHEVNELVSDDGSFEEFVLERDYMLIRNALEREEALVSNDSYRLNTTFIEKQLITDSILSSIYTRL